MSTNVKLSSATSKVCSQIIMVNNFFDRNKNEQFTRNKIIKACGGSPGTLQSILQLLIKMGAVEKIKGADSYNYYIKRDKKRNRKRDSLIELAWAYCEPIECKYCGLYYNQGYVCMHCRKDNS